MVDTEIIYAAGFCCMTDFGHPARQYVKYLDAICGYRYTEEEYGGMETVIAALYPESAT